MRGSSLALGATELHTLLRDEEQCMLHSPHADLGCALTLGLLQTGDFLPCLLQAAGDIALCLGNASRPLILAACHTARQGRATSERCCPASKGKGMSEQPAMFTMDAEGSIVEGRHSRRQRQAAVPADAEPRGSTAAHCNISSCSTAAALLCQQPEQSRAEQGLRAGSLWGFKKGADLSSAKTAIHGLASRLEPSRRCSRSRACSNEHLVNRGKSLAEDKLCWAQAEPAALQV